MQLFNFSKQKYRTLPKPDFKKVIKDFDQQLATLSASMGSSSSKQKPKSNVTFRKKPRRSFYEKIKMAANRYSTVDDAYDYESIKLILGRIKKISPNISVGHPGDHAAILNTECASLSDLRKLTCLFFDDVPESATKQDLHRKLQKFTPVVTIQSPSVPKHFRSECGSCGSKPNWWGKKFSTCYWCSRQFCSSCALEQCHYPRIGGTFHSLCSGCINDLDRADADDWAQSSISLLTTIDDESISESLGCASIAIALGANTHDLLRNIAKDLQSKRKHELAYTIISLELPTAASMTQEMKAHLLSSSILLSMAKLQSKTLDEKWNCALASKEAYQTAASMAIHTDTELVDNIVEEVDQLVRDLMAEKERENDLTIINHTMALEALWTQRDLPGILTYLKDNSADTTEDQDFLLKAFKSFLQNKEPHLEKMLPEDKKSLQFLKAIIRIKEKNYREAFQSIESTAWGLLTSSLSEESVLGACLHTVAEEETNLYSFKSFKKILKAGSKALLFSPPKKSSMNDQSGALLFPSESELTPPFKANWPSLSVVGHNTKCHVKYEEAVLKLFHEKKWTRLQVAWAYIDQFQGCEHPAEMVVCYLHAAMWFVSIFHKSKVDTKTFYGLKCVVMRLLQTSYAITLKALNPGMELYVIRLIIGIMRKIAQIPDSQFVLSEKDLNFLPILLNRLEKVCRLFPFWNPPKVSVSEAVMFNIITRKLHSHFVLALQDVRESPVNSTDLSYQLFENDLRGLLPVNDPVDCRARSMRDLLKTQGWNYSDVTHLMSSALTQRDADGWIIQSKSLGVRQPYAEVNGFVLDLDPQNPSFKLLVVEASHRRQKLGLFSEEDVNTMLRLNSSDYPLFFSLDPPNDNLDKQYHPFQQWRYHTDNVKDTEVLNTMFITDYLMKSFTVGSDVSNHPPFKQRPCKDGLTKHFPPELQRAIRSIHERGGFHSQSQHRFWIEAKEMKYDLQQNGSKIECIFGEMEMIVKSHSLTRRNDGELQDTDEDDDPNSPEAKFAEDMTNNYEELSLYFPQFARLRQLSKLQTVAMMLDSILQNTKEESEDKNVKLPKELIRKIQEDARKNQFSKVNTALSDLKKEIGEWPKAENSHYVRSKVEEIETQMRRKIDEEQSRLYRIHGYGITIDNSDALQALKNIQSDVYNALKKNDEDVLDQVTSVWKGVMKIQSDYTLRQHISTWLAHKFSLFQFQSKTPQDELAEYISSHLVPTEDAIYREVREHNKQTYQAMNKICRQYKSTSSHPPTACKWVPAAICHESSHVSYGGVVFAPTLIREYERLLRSQYAVLASVQPRARATSRPACSAAAYTSPAGAMQDRASGGQVLFIITQVKSTIEDIAKGKPIQLFFFSHSSLRGLLSECSNAQLNKFARSMEDNSGQRAVASAGGGGGTTPPGGGGGTSSTADPSDDPPGDGEKWKSGRPGERNINGIYRMTDGVVYIGRSNDIYRRCTEHDRNVRNHEKTVGKHFTSAKDIKIEYIELPKDCDRKTMQYHEQVQLNIARKTHGDKVINVINAMAQDKFEAMAKELSK